LHLGIFNRDIIIIPVIATLSLLAGFLGLAKIMASVKTIYGQSMLNFKKYNENKFYKFWASKQRLNRKISTLFLSSLLVFIFYVLCKNIVFSIFLCTVTVIVISSFLGSLKSRKEELLHGQLIEFINNTIIMLKAGKTMRNIFKESLSWVKNPLQAYLKKLINRLELNFSFDDALDTFADSCGGNEARLLVSALKINNRIGGDLLFILSSIAETLQNSLKARSSARTITLQSRYSGNIIAFFPVFILIFLYIFMNSSVADFFSSQIGNICLIIGGFLEIAGIFLIKKILDLGR
jgi:tight adherence protein B